MKLDEFRLCVRPGLGLVARFPGSVLVVTAPDWAGMPAVDRLLEECGRATTASPLAARLAALIDDAGPQKVPAFCAIAEDGDALAMFVHGDSQVVITGAQPVMRLSGHGSAGWTSGIHDRLASLAITAAGGSTDAAPSDMHVDLHAGIVPGSGILLLARDHLTAPLTIDRTHEQPEARWTPPPAEADQPGDPSVAPPPARVFGAGVAVAAPPGAMAPAAMAPGTAVVPPPITTPQFEAPTEALPTMAPPPGTAPPMAPPPATAPPMAPPPVTPPSMAPPPVTAPPMAPPPVTAPPSAAPPPAAPPPLTAPPSVSTSVGPSFSPPPPSSMPPPAPARPVGAPLPTAGPVNLAPTTTPPYSMGVADQPPADAIPAAAVDGAPAMVWGIHCKRGHFNNPDARYCRSCGTHMVHQRKDPVLGPRPVLGFLVVDDGSTYKLDADYVVGRQPEIDDTVRAGEARGLSLSDPENTVSDVHATIRLDKWDVFITDLRSRFGTHVWKPGTEGWVRLEPGQTVMLEPRTHLLFGRRTIVFDSVNRR